MRVTIQTVAQLTALSADTIRMWERRYRVVAPARSAQGVRLYSSEDILRLTLLANGVKRGERISHLALLTNEALQQFAHGWEPIGAGAAAKVVQARAGFESQLRRESAAAYFGRSAATSDLLYSLFEAAVRSIAQGLGMEYAAVLEMDEASGSLKLRAEHGWPARTGDVLIPLNSPALAAVAFERRSPVVITDRMREKRFEIVDSLRKEPIQSAIAVPYGGALSGGVVTAHSRERRTFDNEDIAFVNSITRILTVAADRAESYRELQRASEMMSDLIGSFVDGFATIDRQRRITYVNPAFAARMPSDPLIGRAIEEVLPHLKQRRYGQKLDEAMADGRTVQYDVYSEQFRGWFEACWQPISDGLSVHFRDITLRKISQFALEGRGAFAKMVLRSVPGAFWTTDLDLVVLSASGKLLRLLGLAKNQILGRHVSEAFASVSSGEIVMGHRQALEGASAHLDLQYESHKMRMFVEPLRDSSPEPVGTIAFAIETA